MRNVSFAPLFAAAALAAAACSPERKTAPDRDVPDGVNTLITDATGGGQPKFYWLPPIVPSRSYPGTFDPAASPELRICRLTSPQTCGTFIATYTRTSSPAIAVSTSSQSYSIEWSTKPSTITNGDYRAEVRVAGRLMGVADARVVGSAKDVKNVPSGFVGVQKSKSLTFAFRLETGIVGGVAITPKNVFIESGETLQLTATVTDVNGATIPGAAVTWTSTDTASLKVNAAGLVTTFREDTVVVRATSGPVSDSTVIPIVRPRVDQVVVNPTPIEVNVGETATAWAVTYDARGNILTGRLVSWSTSNPAIATVSSAGIVTGIAAGSATISATSEGKVGSSTAIVTVPPPAPVTRVDVSPDLVVTTVGQVVPVTATTYDAANNILTGRTIAWETWDPAVLSIAPNGTTTAVGPGIAQLWATSEGKSDTARVEVTGGTVTCLRPWALPEQWFFTGPYGRAIRAHHGAAIEFGSVGQGTISGYYYPVVLDEPGSAEYEQNIVSCSEQPITLGAPNPTALGNLVEPTLRALDSLFNLDQGATWDSTANGGLGGIVSSNAPEGSESARVVLVGLYSERDHSPGSSSVRFRRTAYVFVETYSRTTLSDNSEIKGDIVFRFLRFGP
jgi:uncharacterized protein YjdB